MLLDSLIFFPDAVVPDAPGNVEERAITTDDGVRLHAWYAPATSRSPSGGGGRAPILV